MKNNILLLLLSLSLLSAAQSDWKLTKDKDGVKVFLREKEKKDFKEYMAVTSFPGTVSAVYAVYQDVANQKNWMSDISTATIVKAVDMMEWYTRYEIKVPWPMDYRDAIYNIKLTQDPITKALSIAFKSYPTLLPKQKGFVRIVTSEGVWRFTPKPNGMVEVMTTGYTNPEGIQPWMVNPFIVDGPHASLLKMKALVKLPKYQNAVFDFIKN